METPFGRRALLPVIYGGAVLLLLLLALFIRGFNREVGDARVVGRFTLLPLFSSRSLEELTLSWNGIALHFARASTPGLSGFETDQGVSDIVLAGGTRLRLTPGSDSGGSLTLTPVSPVTAGSRQPLMIPFTLAGIQVVPAHGSSLAWRSAGKTFLLALPASAHVDADARTISVPVDGSTWTVGFSAAGTPAVAASPRVIPVVGARTAARPAVSPAQLPDEKSLPTAEDLRAAVTGWTNAAYAGWSGARFSPGSAQWRLSDNSLGFSEDIGAALLAEAVARGTWKTFFPLWLDALERQQARPNARPLLFSTSVFVGGTRDFARVNAARTAALVDDASRLLSSSDNVLLRMPGLVGLLLDHGTPDLLSSFLAFMTGRNASALDLPTALGLLEALVDRFEKIGMDDGAKRELQDVVSHRILPALRSTDTGLFLESEPGVVDVSAGVRCGALLLREGAALGDAKAAAMGRGLVVTALGLADASGILPETLKISSGKIVSRTGSVAPEDIYELLPVDRRLPRETSLARQVGPGVSIWTAADIVSADRADATLRLVLGYPAGVPHYFVIQGIGPFTQVQVHGIPWHADPVFARYSDGWTYDEAARMFHGKLTGRSGREEIEITF